MIKMIVTSILVAGGLALLSPASFAQDEASKEQPSATVDTATKLTTVLGVRVGMTMTETLEALQARSKRFHEVPQISADDNSLTLLTDLEMSNVRLGWDTDVEMIAKFVRVSFYRGKVVRLIIKGAEDGNNRQWLAFLCRIPKTEKTSSEMVGAGGMINTIEHCIVDEDERILLLRDADHWNEYVEEKKKLEEFFKKVSRTDEVLD